MHKRTGFSLFATAITASAAVHAVVLATFSRLPIGGDASPPEEQEMAVVFDGPPVPPANEFEIGRPEGKGYGTHASPGMHEQVAHEAPQDQPRLSLDPVGMSPMVEVPSTPLNAPPPQPAPAPPTVAREPVEALLNRVATTASEWTVPDVRDGQTAPPVAPVEPAVAMAPQSMRPPQPPSPPAPVPGTGADSAPQSDSEVDAFSVLGSADFRDGRVTVRAGRQVKTRRPKIRLAGIVDLTDRATPQVVLKVAVDPTGKVTDVEVVKSSGSNEVDQPCRVAMYDWWFEPKKDAAGKAVPDVFRFTISFR
jgi:TonB family protein